MSAFAKITEGLEFSKTPSGDLVATGNIEGFTFSVQKDGKENSQIVFIWATAKDFETLKGVVFKTSSTNQSGYGWMENPTPEKEVAARRVFGLIQVSNLTEETAISANKAIALLRNSV